MFEHYPDMNHDGEKNVQDAVLFHSLMDATAEDGSEPVAPPRVPLPTNSEEEIAYRITKGLFLGVPGLYLLLLFGGVLPINALTAILALVAGTAIIRTLTL